MNKHMVLAVILAAAPVAAWANSGGAARTATSALSAEDERTAMMFATNLCTQIRQLPAGVAPDQVEATIVYALSQSQYGQDIQHAALNRLPRVCQLSPSMSAGLRNATAALNRGATSGTAGLATARGTTVGGVGSTSSNFSSPSIEIGGGSVNYTSPTG